MGPANTAWSLMGRLLAPPPILRRGVAWRVVSDGSRFQRVSAAWAGAALNLMSPILIERLLIRSRTVEIF